MKTLLTLLLLLPLSACDTLVGGAINTVNRIDNQRESKRLGTIYEQSVARYQAMADRGDPKGLYYMAFVHAMDRQRESGMDAYTVKRMYENAMDKGSNDAKVALGNMLVCGSTSIMWGVTCLSGLPKQDRDPQRGLALLKEAAEKSCSVTEPLIGLGDCRERETSIAKMIRLIYRDGDGGIPQDKEQEAYWRARETACQAKIDAINRQRRCYQ